MAQVNYKTKKIRRPGVARLAEKIQQQRPELPWNDCVALAKATYLQGQRK